jgi:hypothetical protein
MAKVVKHWLSKYEALNSNRSLEKEGRGVCGGEVQREGENRIVMFSDRLQLKALFRNTVWGAKKILLCPLFNNKFSVL